MKQLINNFIGYVWYKYHFLTAWSYTHVAILFAYLTMYQQAAACLEKSNERITILRRYLEGMQNG